MILLTLDQAFAKPVFKGSHCQRKNAGACNKTISDARLQRSSLKCRRRRRRKRRRKRRRRKRRIRQGTEEEEEEEDQARNRGGDPGQVGPVASVLSHPQ